MKEGKLIADLKKELASKDALVKAKDETILTQRQALKAKDEALKAKDDLLDDLRQRLEARSTWGSSPMRKLAASTADMWRKCQRTWEECCSSDLDEEPSRTYGYEPVATSMPSTPVAAVTRIYSMESRAGSSSSPSTSPPALLVHGALATEDVASRYLSFLGLNDFAAAARTCLAWSRAAKSVGNPYWRAIAKSRWPEWAAAIEAELGKKYDFKSACKEKLRDEAGDEDLRLVEVWVEQNIYFFLEPNAPSYSQYRDEYNMYHGNPEGVPQISWLSHEGHITGSLAALSALSHNGNIFVPLFKRYENSALAMYDDTCKNGGSFKDLLPVPSNITEVRRRDHNKVRRLIEAIYFKADGSLMDEKPNFAYRNERALFYSGTSERLTQTQILAGITKLRSTETG